MNKISSSPLLLAAVTLVSACHTSDQVTADATSLTSSDTTISSVVEAYDFKSNGSDTRDMNLVDLYTKIEAPSLTLPVDITQELVMGLRKQLKVLKYNQRRGIESQGNLSINSIQLARTVEVLLDKIKSGDTDISDMLDAYLIKGRDGNGNVYFTGYYTPVIKISKTQGPYFQYPIYAKPADWEGRLPSREQIEKEGVLKEKAEVLGYASNLVDIYFMQVQGSGIVEYQDGHRELFAHDGNNGHPYRSIGRYMISKGYTTEEKVSIQAIRRFFEGQPELLEEVMYHNPSYVFFTPKRSNPIGAGMASLTPDYSIAVDPSYIPLGSCLLAKVPIINRKNNSVIRHEYRLLLAQDIGGIIKGPGHVDLYMGPGSQGRRKATATHHYGKLWLLLPKDKDQYGEEIATL